MGDVVPVKVILIDDSGRVKLSRRQALHDLGRAEEAKAPVGDGAPRGDGPPGPGGPPPDGRRDYGRRDGPRGHDAPARGRTRPPRRPRSLTTPVPSYLRPGGVLLRRGAWFSRGAARARVRAGRSAGALAGPANGRIGRPTLVAAEDAGRWRRPEPRSETPARAFSSCSGPAALAGGS